MNNKSIYKNAGLTGIGDDNMYGKRMVLEARYRSIIEKSRHKKKPYPLMS